MMSDHSKVTVVIRPKSQLGLQLAELDQIEKANILPHPSFTLSRMHVGSQENTCLEELLWVKIVNCNHFYYIILCC